MSNRKELPFTNSFGDVIQPGESVYVITTCTHRTHVGKAEYIGYLERSGYDWKSKKSTMVPYVQVKTPYNKTIYWDKRTDKPFKWADYTTSEDFKLNVETRSEPAFRISTLQYNRILPSSSHADRLMAAI